VPAREHEHERVGEQRIEPKRRLVGAQPAGLGPVIHDRDIGLPDPDLPQHLAARGLPQVQADARIGAHCPGQRRRERHGSRGERRDRDPADRLGRGKVSFGRFDPGENVGRVPSQPPASLG